MNTTSVKPLGFFERLRLMVSNYMKPDDKEYEKAKMTKLTEVYLTQRMIDTVPVPLVNTDNSTKDGTCSLCYVATCDECNIQCKASSYKSDEIIKPFPDTIVSAKTEEVAESVVEPVVEPLEPVVEPLEPVIEPLEPVVVPVVEPVVECVVEPVVEPLESVVGPLEPLETVVETVVEPLETVVEPLQPVVEPLQPVVEPLETVESAETPDEDLESSESIFNNVEDYSLMD